MVRIIFGISAAFLVKIGDLDPKVITKVLSNMGLKRCLHTMYSLNSGVVQRTLELLERNLQGDFSKFLTNGDGTKAL